MINQKIKSFFNSTFLVFVSSIMFCSTAVYNGFPLVFNTDTAMYMEAAKNKIVGPDRPILYGLFMKIASLGISLWFVIFFQALILSAILYLYFKYFLANDVHRKFSKIYFLGLCAIISFLMGGSFTTSWLMPDIFTPIALLSMGLLLFVKLERSDKIFTSVIAILSFGMHNANPYICLILIVLFGSLALIKNISRIYLTIGINIKNFLFVFILLIASQLLVSVVHYNYGGEFKSSKGGSVFLMGSLVDMGVVKKYLDENCDKKTYFICQYKDSLPTNFLWDKNSPIYKNGGWKNNEKEYTSIVNDILTTPRYLALSAEGSAKATIKQIFHYGTGEAYKPWQRVSKAIMSNYRSDYLTYNESIQNTGTLAFSFINYSQTFIFALSILFFTFLLFDSKTDRKLKYLIIYLLLGLIVNAWFCATFSGVFHRYQARVIWLLPLPIVLYVLNKKKQVY